MECLPLIVANSDADNSDAENSPAVTGTTGQFYTVTCADGYESTHGFAFTVNCVGDPATAGTSMWENGGLTCDGRIICCVECMWR